MFGISLGEFLVIATIGVLVIGPKDFPDIARNIIRAVAKGKNIIDKTKAELNLLSKEIGIDDIKNEVAIEIANEKTKLEQEITTIIDIYGNEHQVSGLDEIRKDKSKDEIDLEIAQYNQINTKPKV
jgi:Sec-independent protein translocase protein TatA